MPLIRFSVKASLPSQLYMHYLQLVNFWTLEKWNNKISNENNDNNNDGSNNNELLMYQSLKKTDLASLRSDVDKLVMNNLKTLMI